MTLDEFKNLKNGDVVIYTGEALTYSQKQEYITLIKNDSEIVTFPPDFVGPVTKLVSRNNCTNCYVVSGSVEWFVNQLTKKLDKETELKNNIEKLKEDLAKSEKELQEITQKKMFDNLVSGKFYKVTTYSGSCIDICFQYSRDEIISYYPLKTYIRDYLIREMYSTTTTKFSSIKSIEPLDELTEAYNIFQKELKKVY